jgi:hypothetical protein
MVAVSSVRKQTSSACAFMRRNEAALTTACIPQRNTFQV